MQPNQTNKDMDSTKKVAILFDFDGVVMDTESQYTLFWNEQGRKYLPEIEEYGKVIKGQTLTQIYDRYFPGNIGLQERITAELNVFETRMQFDYIPGADTFIRELRAEGYPTAIVTSSNNLKMANAFKAHPELPDLVDHILTADMFTHSKPHPECFLMGAKVCGALPENCIVFEDSFHGLEAGNRAGMTVIGLATTNPREAIADKAKAVIDDFTGFTVERMKLLAALQ